MLEELHVQHGDLQAGESCHRGQDTSICKELRSHPRP